MKAFFIFVCGLSGMLLCAGPALPVIYNEEKESAAAPAETGKLLEIPQPGMRNDANTPRGSTAGRLAVNNKSFQWTPSQIKGKVTGGADLIDAVLSQDESMLLIAERIGGSDAPNSTRLIMVNLRNGKIIRSILLEKERITRFLFIPGSERLLAVRSAQSEFSKPHSLIVINLRNGRIVQQSRAQEDAITSLASDGEKVWFTIQKQQMIRELSLDDFKAEPALIRTQTEDVKVAISPDQTKLAAFGKKHLELFKITQNASPVLEKSFPIPENVFPVCAEILTENAQMILLLEPGKQAFLFQNGTIQTLAEKITGARAYFSKEKTLLLGVEKNNAVLKFTLPSITPERKPMVPGKLKPLSRNSNWKLLPLTGSGIQAILFDHRANIMRLEMTRRRWKKHTVLTVDRTGFR